MSRNKYTKEYLEKIVANSNSIRDVLRNIGLSLSGGNHLHISNLIKKFKIDRGHFYNKKHTRVSNNKKTACEVLVKRNEIVKTRTRAVALRRSLLEIGRKYKCEECLIVDEWNGKKITLQIDHVDGDFSNNLPENLRFLCPNCHSQTETYGNKIKENKHNRVVGRTKKCDSCDMFVNRRTKRCVRCHLEYIKVSGIRRKSKPDKRTVERPSKEELQKMIGTMSWCAIGRKYNVSDNAIRKWATSYGIELKRRNYCKHESV